MTTADQARDEAKKRAIYLSAPEAHALSIAIWKAMGDDGFTRLFIDDAWSEESRATVRVHLARVREKIVRAFPYAARDCDE